MSEHCTVVSFFFSFCFFFFFLFFSFNITSHFLSWVRVSEGSEREFGSFTARISWETFASGPGGPSGKHRTRERLPRRRMKIGEEGACSHVGLPRRGQRSPAKQGEGLRAQEGRAGISSDGFALVRLRLWGHFHCPGPWDSRNIGQKGTGSSEGRGVARGVFGSTGS